MEYLIIISKAAFAAAMVTIIAMGSMAAICAVFPGMAEDEACQPEDGE